MRPALEKVFEKQTRTPSAKDDSQIFMQTCKQIRTVTITTYVRSRTRNICSQYRHVENSEI